MNISTHEINASNLFLVAIEGITNEQVAQAKIILNDLIWKKPPKTLQESDLQRLLDWNTSQVTRN